MFRMAIFSTTAARRGCACVSCVFDFWSSVMSSFCHVFWWISILVKNVYLATNQHGWRNTATASWRMWEEPPRRKMWYLCSNSARITIILRRRQYSWNKGVGANRNSRHVRIPGLRSWTNNLILLPASLTSLSLSREGHEFGPTDSEKELGVHESRMKLGGWVTLRWHEIHTLLFY